MANDRCYWLHWIRLCLGRKNGPNCYLKTRQVTDEWHSPVRENTKISTTNSYKHIEAKTKWQPFCRRHLKCFFLNEKVWISIKSSLKFVHKGPINSIPSLVQTMAWRRPGDKPLSEPMTARLPTHICVTRCQWVNSLSITLLIHWIHKRHPISHLHGWGKIVLKKAIVGIQQPYT